MTGPRVPCPRCGRSLKPEGEVAVTCDQDNGSATLLFYQCEDCVLPRELFGEVMDLPLTFCVDHLGRPFDPADSEGRIRF